jgi:hypothetical protein
LARLRWSVSEITAAFDGGGLTSDGGLMLLSLAERWLGIARRLARRFPDAHDPTRISNTLGAKRKICCPGHDVGK